MDKVKSKYLTVYCFEVLCEFLPADYFSSLSRVQLSFQIPPFTANQSDYRGNLIKMLISKLNLQENIYAGLSHEFHSVKSKVSVGLF